MANILLVEDDVGMADIVKDHLEHQRHTVQITHTGQDAASLLKLYEYDCIILDWELPDGVTGISLCKEYRARGGTAPVLMLTGRKEIDEKETGFGAGADDYLTKPFIVRELIARVQALLRRPPNIITRAIAAGDLELDTLSVSVKKAGEQIQLLKTEFALLEFLMRHSGQIFSADALLERVWTRDDEATLDGLRACVTRLRKKIDTPGQDSYIENVRGLGYRFSSKANTTRA